MIKNLPSYGIHRKEKDLFVNYLFNRKQAVFFESNLSKPRNITCGVPQGSIFVPLLFSLTFNDIKSVLIHSKIITYADDTVIYVPGKSLLKDIETCLNEDFHEIVTWLKSMDLICNNNMKKDHHKK